MITAALEAYDKVHPRHNYARRCFSFNLRERISQVPTERNQAMSIRPITDDHINLEREQCKRRLAIALNHLRNSLDEIERYAARDACDIACGPARNLGQHIGDVTESLARMALLRDLTGR